MATLAKMGSTGDIAKLESAMAELDKIADECGLQKVANEKGRFAAAMAMADGVHKLRNAMTQEIVEASLMPLMNTALGFLTDRDPARARSGKEVVPYGWQTVRDCVIEGVIRGMRPVNNEINIIGGRCYCAKTGLERVVGEYPGVTDLVLSAGVPAIAPAGALVPFSATWKKDGVPQRLERIDRRPTGGADERIPVKTYQDQGADLIIGKATRKMLALVYGKLCNSKVSIPDGEVGDPDFTQARETTVKVVEGVSLDKIQPGKPSEYQPHDKPNLEELRKTIKNLGGKMDPNIADNILIRAGLVETTIDECEDPGILGAAVEALKLAAGVP